MTTPMQKRLAIGGALTLVTLVFAYKAYMVSAAFSSQPACVAAEGATSAPALRAC